MAKYLVEDTTLNKIASAVRSKGGTSAKYSVPNGLVSAIMSIPTTTTNVTEGSLQSAVITKSSNTVIPFGSYVEDDNFILIFTVRVSSGSWAKYAFCPAVSTTQFLDIDYTYATSAGFSTVIGGLGGGTNMSNWNAVYSVGHNLSIGSNCTFGSSAVLLYVG